MNEQIKAGAEIHAGDGGYSIGTQENYLEFARGRNRSFATNRYAEIAKQVDEWFDDLSIEFSRQAWTEKFAELIVTDVATFVGQQRNDIPACGFEFEAAIKHVYGIPTNEHSDIQSDQDNTSADV